jgi:hypothetical protein
MQFSRWPGHPDLLGESAKVEPSPSNRTLDECPKRPHKQSANRSSQRRVFSDGTRNRFLAINRLVLNKGKAKKRTDLHRYL